jgi:hypothetical protein
MKTKPNDIAQLETIATQLRAIRPEMQRLGEAIKPVSLTDVMDYINHADVKQCHHIILLLVERVSDLVGCASELEDAACSLADEIESENELCEGRR